MSSSFGASSLSVLAISARPKVEARSIASKRNLRASTSRSEEATPESANARPAKGAEPGVVTAQRQPSARSSGMTPARTMDDFPDPDGPTTAVKWKLRIFFVRAAVSRPRPENHFELLVSNGRRPTNGASERSIGPVMRHRFHVKAKYRA